MDKTEICAKPSEIFISRTLYRALFILKLLMQKPMSLLEIKEECQKDKIIGTKISDDTIRVTISTLKSAGCTFGRLRLKNKIKYELLKCPFKYSLKNEDVEFLSDIRQQLAPVISLNNLMKMNSFYEKINNFVNETDNKFLLNNESIYPNIDIVIFEEMFLFTKKNVFVNVLYNSKGILKPINIVPYFMKYENDTVYLWCYNEKYERFSYLRMDKMVKINKVLPEKKPPVLEKNKIILKIKKEKLPQLNSFYKTKNLVEDGNFYEAEVEYMNLFHIVQTVLELSPDCIVVSDGDVKDKVIEKINKMRRLYLS